MSSSRSIAAARNRRTGDSALQTRPPNKQPVTSINSQRAFSQQSYNQNANTNVNAKSLPFSKLTVSDAVGLITLRLGKVEQYLIDTQNSDNHKSGTAPASSLDNSVISTIVNRLDSLEKQNMNTNSDVIDQLTKEVNSIKKIIQSIQAEIVNVKNDVNARFNDVDFAFAELEKNLETKEEAVVEETVVEAPLVEVTAIVEGTIVEDPVIECVMDETLIETDKDEQKGRKGKKGKKGDKPNSIDLSAVENSLKSESEVSNFA